MQTSDKPVALVVGGTSGLGFEIANQLTSIGYKAYVAGRHDPHEIHLEFRAIDLIQETYRRLVLCCGELIMNLPRINTFVYAAGFGQEGTIDSLSDTAINAMMCVGLAAPAALLHEIIFKQGCLDEFIAITSTSQLIHRPQEPMYAATKAGLGMLAKSVADGDKVKKTLVFAPGGMNTKFGSGQRQDVDRSTYLDPAFVAGRIMELRVGNYTYLHYLLPRYVREAEVIERR